MNIISLTGVISYRKVNSYGRFQDTKTKGDNNYFRLFKAIKKGKVLNEEHAQDYLGIENRATFLKFKGRYIRKLLQHLESSNVQKYQGRILEHELIEQFSKAKALINYGDNKNAIELISTVHKEAIKLGEIYIALGAVIELRTYYSFFAIDRKKYLHYCDLVTKYMLLFRDHDDLMSWYVNLSHYFFTKTSKQEFDLIAHRTLNKLEAVTYEEHMHAFKVRYFEQLIFLYTYFNRIDEAKEISNEAISYITSFNHCSRTDKYLILNEVINLQMKQKDFSSALKTLQEINLLRTRKNNTFNAFIIYSSEFILNTHLKLYDKLPEIILHVFKDNAIFKYQNVLQSWKIKEAYCNILILSGKIQPITSERHPIKPLRINKFINDTELYSKDKRGLNISIILVPLIYYLIKKKYGKILDKIDSLKQYSFKYLRKDETLRSNCFIKMVLKLPEANYHPERTARYVAKYKKILLENPAELSMSRTDTEIIPYEDLWGIIEEIMEKNQRK